MAVKMRQRLYFWYICLFAEQNQIVQFMVAQFRHFLLHNRNVNSNIFMILNVTAEDFHMTSDSRASTRPVYTRLSVYCHLLFGQFA